MPAVAAVAGLDVAVLALVAIILLIAFAPLFRPLVQGLSRLPIIGASVAGSVESVLALGIGAAQGWAQWALSPLADLLNTTATVAVYLSQSSAGAVEATAGAVWRLAYVDIPAAQVAAEGYAAQLFSQLLAYVVAAVAGAEQLAEQLAQQVAQYALTLALQDAQLAELLAAQAESYAAQLAAQQLAYTQAAVLGAEQLAEGIGAQAESYAGQLAAQGIAYTQAAVLAAEQLAEQIGVQAEDYARALSDQDARYAEQVGAAVLGAAAAATAAVAARVTAVEDSPCQQFCSPLGDIGGLLQGLEDAGLYALLLGMIEQAEQHPGQVAAVITDVFAPLARDVAGSLSLGIPA